jgi:hypothetical protein
MTPIDPLKFLAPIGLSRVIEMTGGESPIDDEAGDDDLDTERHRQHLRHSERFAEWIGKQDVRDLGPNAAGCRIGPIYITWPDRLPGLVTWSGQQSLKKIVARWALLAAKCTGDIYEFTAAETGVTGIDPATAVTTLDVGFSLNALKIPIVQRVGLELLAIIGLESLPLVSWPRERKHARSCGLIHDGICYRLVVEHREGYYYRWTMMVRGDEVEAVEPKECETQ